jgi:hypothetical protein
MYPSMPTLYLHKSWLGDLKAVVRIIFTYSDYFVSKILVVLTSQYDTLDMVKESYNIK